MDWNCLLAGCVKDLGNSPSNSETTDWMYTLFAPDYAGFCGGCILGFSIDIIEPHNFRTLKDLWSNQFVQFLSRKILDELLLLTCNVNHKDITLTPHKWFLPLKIVNNLCPAWQCICRYLVNHQQLFKCKALFVVVKIGVKSTVGVMGRVFTNNKIMKRLSSHPYLEILSS